ncbi:MAG: hypothetical protein LBV08_01105 [Clostridiales bacterium]|jgi:flagellar M-ring protein FliF|nr:hypothetical protein [Clostridiales bacterium]
MQDRFRRVYENLIAKWNALGKVQQIRIIAVSVVLLLSIAVTAYLTTRPQWEALVSGRSNSEIAQIQQYLTDAGYRVRLGDNGTSLDVLQEDSLQARVDLSTQDIKTDGALTFEDAINLTSLSATEMVKRRTFLAYDESKLEEALKMFEGVRDADVSISMPESSSHFIENTEKPSVRALLDVNSTFDKSQGEAVARLIAASVIGLSMDSIEILDTGANVIYSGSTKGIDGSGSKESVELLKKNEIENQIRLLLTPLFDEVKISSNLVFDWDKNTVVRKTVSPPIEDSTTGLPQRQNTEKQAVENANPDAAVGLDPNNNQVADYQTGSAGVSNLDVENNTVEYVYDTEEWVTEQQTGRLVPESSSMMLSLYKYREYNQEIMERGDLLQGSTWDQFKENTTITKLDVDPDILNAIITGTSISNISIILHEVPIFVDKVVTPPDFGAIGIFTVLAAMILLLAYGLLKFTKPDEITEVEPELSVEDLLVSTQLEEIKEEELAKLEEVNFNKESQTKKQIEKFVQEKPEAVAQLLRNWLNEEWE